LLKIGVRL